MPTALINLLKNLPSPLLLIAAGYIGLRALEIALKPQEAFRNRTAHKHVAEKRKPGRTSRIRFRPVMNAQETANNILVDLDAESQRDLLSDAGTAPARIPTFHGNDSVDEVFLRSLRAGPTPALGRKQHAVLSFPQHTVQMQ